VCGQTVFLALCGGRAYGRKGPEVSERAEKSKVVEIMPRGREKSKGDGPFIFPE